MRLYWITALPSENVKDGTAFTPENWDVWVQKAEAKAVPGAKEFLQFANENGVQIYYVSDRAASQVDATIKNLEKKAFLFRDVTI